MLASEVCQAKAYYRGPYDCGAVYLLITDNKLQWKVDDPLLRVLTVFPQVISALDIPDHRAALTAYLDSYGIDPGRVEAEFDEMGWFVQETRPQVVRGQEMGQEMGTGNDRKWGHS